MYETVTKKSCGKVSLRNVCVDGVIERSKCSAQGGRYLRGETEVEGLESGADDAGVDFGEEEGHASAIGREDIAVLAIEPEETSEEWRW